MTICLRKNGQPERARSDKHVGRIWPAKHYGRPVSTVPGPDTWNPNTLKGAA